MSLPDVPWFSVAPVLRRHLVGVSGGADSVALLHLLVRHGFRRLVVCHLNHRLRGREADADALFVGELAASLGLVVEVGRVDVGARARRDGVSVEVAARRERQRFFAVCAAKHRCPRVVLAHHADDQVETLLLNLLRGSAGLVGMREETSHRIEGRSLVFVRPLLGVRRAELRAWLAAESLVFREDASNAEPCTPRNRLRHEVLPLLADIAGHDPVPAIVRAARIAAETRAALDSLRPLCCVEDPQGRLHLPSLRSLPDALQAAVLHDFLRRHGVPDLSARLLAAARGIGHPAAAPALDLPGGQRLRRRGGRLFLENQA